MKVEAKSRPTMKTKPAGTKSAQLAEPAGPVRPGGKLGDIIDRLAGKNGPTADELVARPPAGSGTRLSAR